MPVNTRDLKELPEEKMLFLSYTTDSETDICVNMSGNPGNSIPWLVPVAADALRPVLEKLVKTNCLWNLHNSWYAE
jgi:hypothetical protein